MGRIGWKDIIAYNSGQILANIYYNFKYAIV